MGRAVLASLQGEVEKADNKKPALGGLFVSFEWFWHHSKEMSGAQGRNRTADTGIFKTLRFSDGQVVAELRPGNARPARARPARSV